MGKFEVSNKKFSSCKLVMRNVGVDNEKYPNQKRTMALLGHRKIVQQWITARLVL